MLFRILPVFLTLSFMPVLVAGQSERDETVQSPLPTAEAQSNAASVAAPEKEKTPDASSGKGWRDTSGYPFPALADTVAAVQNMVQAMILRDYCANEKLPDNFVRNRLTRFSRITGREEDCQSLFDYTLLQVNFPPVDKR
jgi:hypothetical protein